MRDPDRRGGSTLPSYRHVSFQESFAMEIISTVETPTCRCGRVSLDSLRCEIYKMFGCTRVELCDFGREC